MADYACQRCQDQAPSKERHCSTCCFYYKCEDRNESWHVKEWWPY